MKKMYGGQVQNCVCLDVDVKQTTAQCEDVNRHKHKKYP